MFKRVKSAIKNIGSSSSNIAVPSQHIPEGNYNSVVDQRQHASDGNLVATQSGDRYFLRGSWHKPSKYYHALKMYPLIKAEIDKSGWQLLLDVTMPNSDNKFVEALITRWWDTTHTFHLPKVEIGITPLDFTIFTGISIGCGYPITKPDPTPYTNCTATEAIYFPHFNNNNRMKIKSKSVSCKFVSDWLEECIKQLKAGNTVDPTLVARAFLFYTIGQLFFPNGNSTINLGWLGHLGDLDKMDELDWGSAILARVFYALDECCRRGQKSLNCFWEFVEFTMAEYICSSTPVIRSYDMDCWPRIKKWSRVQRLYTPGALQHNYYITGEQLEMRSQQAICWAPYASSTHFNTKVMLQRAFHLSMCRMLLWDPVNFAVWYLGDRCYRQLTGKIVLPLDPPNPMIAISMDVYDDLKSREWIRADECVVLSDEIGWANYWATVSKGAILGALTRNVNTDGVGYAAAVPDHIEIPHPPRPDFNPMVYDTQQTAKSSSMHPSPFDWTADITGGGGSIYTVNIQNNHPSKQAPTTVRSQEEWKHLYYDARDYAKALQDTLLQETDYREVQLAEHEAQIALKDAEILELQQENRRLRHRRSRTPQDIQPARHSMSHFDGQVDPSQAGTSYQADQTQNRGTSYGFSTADPNLPYNIDPSQLTNEYITNLWSELN